MNRRNFLCATAGAAFAPTFGSACVKKESELCGVAVPNNDFGRGTVNRPADFQIEACLPDEAWQMIQPSNGQPAKWVLRLVTFDAAGQVRWHASKTMNGSQCKTQGVYKGTHVFTYLTCKTFTGWLSTGAIHRGGQYELQRIDWSMTYQWLDQHFPSKLQ